ncbi:unnamed protein product [Blepharisma stoltei]|uniref:Potassium channel domain-containing protein n=1 Tax=Blepharisma stoltei TaxID=1481888 RepID=A0AAU9IMW0_9CILI|nr:unnamed protein product [Blepharisma stoltei]
MNILFTLKDIFPRRKSRINRLSAVMTPLWRTLNKSTITTWHDLQTRWSNQPNWKPAYTEGLYENKPNMRISNQLFNQWRAFEMASAIFSCLGIISSSIDYEMRYSPYRTHDNCEEESSVSDFWKTFTLFSTIASMVFLLMRDHSKSLWERYLIKIEPHIIIKLGNFPVKIAKIQKKCWNFHRFLDIFLLCIFTYPHMNIKIDIPYRYNFRTIDTCYNLNEILYYIMFFRIIRLYKAIMSFTPYQNYIARSFCLRQNTSANARFAFRCMIFQHPTKVVLFLLLIPSIIIFGLMLRIFERPLYDLTGKDFTDPTNSMWLVFSSLAMIGYGDYFPSSIFGRVTVAFCWITGAIAVSLVLLNAEKRGQFSKGQSEAFSLIFLSKSAAKVVQMAIKYYTCKKKHGSTSYFSKRAYKALEDAINRFKKNKLELTELIMKKQQMLVEAKRRVKALEKKMSAMEKLYTKLFTHIKWKLIAKNSKKY